MMSISAEIERLLLSLFKQFDENFFNASINIRLHFLFVLEEFLDEVKSFILVFLNGYSIFWDLFDSISWSMKERILIHLWVIKWSCTWHGDFTSHAVHVEEEISYVTWFKRDVAMINTTNYGILYSENVI